MSLQSQSMTLDLHERLDPVQFWQSWSQVMARHAVLRTRLRWLNLKDPIQEVFGEVSLPWAEEDWTQILTCLPVPAARPLSLRYVPVLAELSSEVIYAN